MPDTSRVVPMSLQKRGRSLVMGLLAGVLYGGWAAVANWHHDLSDVARASAVQFLLSFCSTSFLTLMIELLLARSRSILSLVLAATGPYSFMVAVFASAHWLSKTPNIARTIAPSALVGLLYCIAYVLKRSRDSRKEPSHTAPR